MKEIKKSNRGLTFSFHGKEKFQPGAHYRYVIEKNRIVIAPSEDGGNIISRKRSGLKIKSLIDLRSREVRELVSTADHMEIEFCDDMICVYIVREKGSENIISLENERTRISELHISRELLLAAGCESDVVIPSGNATVIEKTDGKEHQREISDVIRVISLFSGAGMLDKSFLGNGHFDIVYAADYEPDAVRTYQRNIGNHIERVDIRTLKGDMLPKADIIIGGPPCQPFSNANRHERSRGIAHPEGDMFLHYLRLVKECGVKAFFIENVPFLLSSKCSGYMDVLREELSEYEIASGVITDSDVGGFTIRKRAFVVGSRIGTPVIPDLKFRPVRCVKDALSRVDETWPNFSDITKSNDVVRKKISMIPEGGNWKDLPEEMWTKSVHSNMYRRLDRNKPSITLANWRKFLLSPPKWDDSDKWDRILSVSEAAALQGLSKDFEFVGSMHAKQQMAANGVTMALGKFARNIIERLFMVPVPAV